MRRPPAVLPPVALWEPPEGPIAPDVLGDDEGPPLTAEEEQRAQAWIAEIVQTRRALHTRLLPRPVPGVTLAFLPLDNEDEDGGAVTVVAEALLSKQLTGPDARIVYDLLTRMPGRRPGTTVHLAELTDELDALGRSWLDIAVDWERVVGELAELPHAKPHRWPVDLAGIWHRLSGR